MARKQARPLATQQSTLDLLQVNCRACGSRLLVARHSHRKVTTLEGVFHLTLKVYHCPNHYCPPLPSGLSARRRREMGTATWRVRAGRDRGSGDALPEAGHLH